MGEFHPRPVLLGCLGGGKQNILDGSVNKFNRISRLEDYRDRPLVHYAPPLSTCRLSNDTDTGRRVTISHSSYTGNGTAGSTTSIRR